MKNPIGIFDSGIGGLTVVKQLMRLLPDEQLIYFGDTARIPYGTKSNRLVQQYALEDAYFLLQYDIKLLVVACNTASSIALNVLKEQLDIPVVGVVHPGTDAAVKLTRNNRIGVIGTSATINSNAYARSIYSIKSEAGVSSKACPLLVPLVEEGWLDDEITILTLKKYLKPLMEENIDTLILGCTHYPLLQNTIQHVVGPDVTLIDSGKETARAVKTIMEESNLENKSGRVADNKFYVSDIPAKFQEVGSRFLGAPLHNIERVNFEDFLIEAGKRMPRLDEAMP